MTVCFLSVSQIYPHVLKLYINFSKVNQKLKIDSDLVSHQISLPLSHTHTYTHTRALARTSTQSEETLVK